MVVGEEHHDCHAEVYEKDELYVRGWGREWCVGAGDPPCCVNT